MNVSCQAEIVRLSKNRIFAQLRQKKIVIFYLCSCHLGGSHKIFRPLIGFFGEPFRRETRGEHENAGTARPSTETRKTIGKPYQSLSSERPSPYPCRVVYALRRDGLSAFYYGGGRE